MTIPAFGWHNDSPPNISAANLEAMHLAGGTYTDQKTGYFSVKDPTFAAKGDGTTDETLINAVVQNGLGDAVVVCGQNNTFINLELGNCTGCALVLDGGAGGNTFFNFEIGSSQQYHIEFRETFTASTYSVPSNNVFIGGRTEYGYQSTTGANSGCVHVLAGNHNHFIDCDFDTPTGTRHVYVEQNTVSGRSSDYNTATIFEECGFTSGSSNLQACIMSGSALMGGDYPCVILRGNNVFSTTAAVPAISWAAQYNFVRLEGRYTIYQNPTGFYAATWSGTYLRYGNSGTDWQALTLGTSVTDGSATFGSDSPGAMVDSSGIGHIVANLNIGAALAANVTLATLPSICRPEKNVFAPVTIWQSGATTGTAAYISIGGKDGTSPGVLNMGTALSSGQTVFINVSYPMFRG